jgi:hypothetical protein
MAVIFQSCSSALLPPAPACLMLSVLNIRGRLLPQRFACACRTRYPAQADRQGEHVTMANKLLGIFLCLIFSACSTLPEAPTTEERAVRQDSGDIEKPGGTTEAKKPATPPAPRCTKQLDHGYTLRERIDNEYWQSRRDGTFRDRSDEFTARWGEEAGQWAAETKAVLLQIGGPTAKSRFQNAKAPIGMVSGDLRWNNIRNFLRTRLAALASICKAP